MKIDKLDGTAFKHQKVEEASHHLSYWEKQSYAKRLQAANYLNSVAYNFDVNNPPSVDKTIFIYKIGQRPNLEILDGIMPTEKTLDYLLFIVGIKPILKSGKENNGKHFQGRLQGFYCCIKQQ